LKPTAIRSALAAAKKIRDEFRKANKRKQKVRNSAHFADFLQNGRLAGGNLVPGEAVEKSPFTISVNHASRLRLRDDPLPLATDRFVRHVCQLLQYGAEDAYPEGWQNNQYANPDASSCDDNSPSKGMQWPVLRTRNAPESVPFQETGVEDQPGISFREKR